MGNITFKSDAGTLAYNVPNKPYAVGEQTPPTPQYMSVRYIRDVIQGSNINAYNHWVEIQAINNNDINVALGKAISGATVTNPHLITDGNTYSNPYADGGAGLKTITVDLGQAQSIADVKLWHYYQDWRSYNSSKTEVSANGTNWTTLHDATTDDVYRESSLGRSYGLNIGTPMNEQTITYTSNERPASVNCGGLTATFQYNPAGKRTFMKLATNNSLTITYLGGNYEMENRAGTITERLYLGGSPYNAPCVAIRTGGSGSWQLHYIHRDYLGSIVAVSDNNGNAVEKRSYDAWGRLRHPQTLKPYGPGAQPTLLLGRGYTGHEHLPELDGLINMNARLYDPITGRFLSPDPYVQAPDFSQSYNRYTYCQNNPLIYKDPSGENLFKYYMSIHDHEGGGGFWYRGDYYYYDSSVGGICSWSWGAGSGVVRGGFGGGNGFGGNGAVYQKTVYDVYNTYHGYNFKIENQGNIEKYHFWSNSVYQGRETEWTLSWYLQGSTIDYPNGFEHGRVSRGSSGAATLQGQMPPAAISLPAWVAIGQLVSKYGAAALSFASRISVYTIPLTLSGDTNWKAREWEAQRKAAENPVFGNPNTWRTSRGIPWNEPIQGPNNKSVFPPGAPDWMWPLGAATLGWRMYRGLDINAPQPPAPYAEPVIIPYKPKY